MGQDRKGNRQADTLLKGTLVLTAAGIIVKIIGSLNWVILSQVLGGEGIGLYQMAFPIYLLFLSISTAGIPVAISIITADKVAVCDYRGANRVFRLSLTLLAGLGLFFSVLMYCGAAWLIDCGLIRDGRAYYALVALSPAIFLVTILSSFRGYLQGWQIMTPTAVSQIAEQVFRVGAMLFFANTFLYKGLEYAAGGASLGAGTGAAAALAVLVYYYWRFQAGFQSARESQAVSIEPEAGGSIIRRIFKLALPVSLSSIMLPLVANLDLVVVPVRLEAAGYTVEQATELFGYLTGMAVPLVNLATVLTAALATSLVPAISEAYSQGDYRCVLQRIAAAIRLASLVTIPGSVALWLLAEPVAGVIYHAPQAGEPIRILAAGVFLLGLHQITTGVLQGIGRTAIPVASMGVAALIKVMLNWLLTAIPALGIQGAAWATVADIGLAAALNLYFVHRYTGFCPDIRNLGKIIGAAMAMGGVMFFCYDRIFVLTSGHASATLIALVLGGGVYSIVLLALGGVNERDIERLPLVGLVLANTLRSLGIFRRPMSE